MAFSFMFWNVERFAGGAERTRAVQEHIKNLDPDLFCLCEIRDKVALRSLLMERLTDYDFAVTDGGEEIELLTGWRKSAFRQILFTQRREFKAGNTNLRPGALTTVNHGGTYYNFLFLHTDSGTSFRDYSNRLDMYDKVWSLKETLDGITDGGAANFIALGDWNTMGKHASGSFPEISAEREIEELGRDANTAGMRILDKTYDQTLAWKKWPSEPEYRLSNLDHMLATQNLQFRQVAGPSGQQVEVRVEGWNLLSGNARTDFIEEISDHCAIYAELL